MQPSDESDGSSLDTPPHLEHSHKNESCSQSLMSKGKEDICSSVMEFRLADLFSEKIIAGSHEVPDPPSLAQMTFTQCTSMPELKIDPGAPPGGQI